MNLPQVALRDEYLTAVDEMLITFLDAQRARALAIVAGLGAARDGPPPVATSTLLASPSGRTISEALAQGLRTGAVRPGLACGHLTGV
jgi:hypothetical protein